MSMHSNVSRADMQSAALFTVAYLVIATMFAAYIRNWEFILYVIVILVVGFAVYLLDARVRFSQGVLWCLSVWGLLHLLGGLLPVPLTWTVEGDKYVLYSLWFIPGLLKYDHIMHIYGFGVCTWGCWQIIRSIMPPGVYHPLELILAILASNGLGSWNEIIEFLAVMMLPDTNVGGYANTGWDLISNLIGSLTAALIIRYGGLVRSVVQKR